MDILATALPALEQALLLVLQPQQLMYMITGVLLGLTVGVLPGLGGIAGLSLFGSVARLCHKINNPLTSIMMMSDIIVGTDHGAGRLEKDDGLLRDVHAGLFGVVGEVQSDADEFAGAGHGGTEAGVTTDAGSVGSIFSGPGRELVEVGRIGEKIMIPVHPEARRVDARAVFELQAGFLGALRAKAEQFHRRGP